MRPLLRSLLAIALGYAAWPLVSLPLTQLVAGWAGDAVRSDLSTDSVGVMAAYILISVLASVTSGWVVARIAGRAPMAHGWIMAALNLLTGVLVQASVWHTMPVAYHLVFLGLVVPSVLAGASLAKRRGASRARAVETAAV